MTSEARLGILRARAEAIADVEERGRLVRLLVDLSRLNSIVELPGRILERYQVDGEDIERARWLRDRLDEEISGRIARAESA